MEVQGRRKQKVRSCDGGEQVLCDPHVWRGVRGREASDVDGSGGRAVELVQRWEKELLSSGEPKFLI